MRTSTAVLSAAGLVALAALAPGQGEAQTPFEMNIGSLAPENTPWRDMLVKLEQHVEKGSNGQINVILRPPGLMAEVEMVRETRKGERLQGAGVTTAAIAEGGNVPQLQLVELPFLFKSYEEADHLLDTVLFTELSDVLSRRGFILGMWSENGWRGFGSKGKPIRKPEDLVGLKMRSQESAVHMAMWRAFGANAVQKPTTEILTSLQSNVIDGLDNTALYTLAGGLAEPLDYFTLSRHIYQPAAVVFSRTWYSKLPEGFQKLLLEPKDLYTTPARKAIRAEDAQMVSMFPDMGMEVVELTDAERKAFEAKGQAMHDSFAATVEGGPELLKKIRDALAAYRAK